MPDSIGLLVVIVEKSHHLQVFSALEEVGITAFTRLEGTGSGVWQATERWVDPEKVIFMSVVRRDAADPAFAALRSRAGLDEPGRGIAFFAPVSAGIGVGLPG